jgi:hypothetical protein
MRRANPESSERITSDVLLMEGNPTIRNRLCRHCIYGCGQREEVLAL